LCCEIAGGGGGGVASSSKQALKMGWVGWLVGWFVGWFPRGGKSK